MNETWDATFLKISIAQARERVEFTARIYRELFSLNRDGHKPVVELIFYLAKLDYDIKVLLHQFLNDPDNRTIWERYLILELHEALQSVPKALSRARVYIAQRETESGLDLVQFDSAAKSYSLATKPINKDKEFIEILTMIRNGVAAHHGLKRGKDMDESIAWILSAEQSRRNGLSPFDSQVTEYAIKLGRAVQTLGQDLAS